MEKLFLELLTSSVRQRQVNKDMLALEDKDWTRLLALSAYHQIIPIIYEQVSKSESFRLHPPAVAGMWKREAMLSVARQVRVTDEFLRLYGEMCACGLRPLVLKGLVCRNLYPMPDYRMSSDEDLLIPREDFWKMNEFLTGKGFTKAESDASLQEAFGMLHEVGYRNVQNGLYLEVHLTLFAEESGAYGHFNRLFNGLHNEVSAVKIQDRKVWTLNETEHMLFLLCHNVKHFLHSGFGVRQVMDMILFAEAYGDKIDWKRLIRIAKKNQMYKFLIHLFDIGVGYLEFDPVKACWPSEADRLDGTLDSEDLLRDLLAGGIYGSSTEERRHSSNITLSAVDKEGTFAGGILESLFPKRTYMDKKYKYVKKYPWLLPIGWCQRIVEHVLKKDYVSNRKIVEIGHSRVKLLRKYGMVRKG